MASTRSSRTGQIRWSLVTVTYNSAATLREHWSGVTLPDDVEWVVVDNGSTDGTVGTAQRLGARVLLQGENLGFSGANNVGLAESSGAYVAFVNPDVTVDPCSLALLERELDQQEALVAPQLVNPDGSLQPNGRGMPSVVAKLNHRLRLSSASTAEYLRTADAGESMQVVWVMGAAVAGRRSTFERLGGWDDAFFLYYEDSDICLRAWRHGVPVVVCGSARWVHSWARETRSLRLKPWLHELSSAVRFYRRYPAIAVGSRLGRLVHDEVAVTRG